jgi:luciferase-like monooxygenase
MARIGYTLSSEEQKPNDLVRYSRHAEKAGFDFLMISDHFHPWVDQQGQSPFVWSVIGGVAQVTEELPSHFEAAAESVEEDDVAESVVCGPDPEPYGKQVEEFVEAGYDHVYFHQIGPDQEGFLQFYERELQPALREKVAA